MLTLGHISYANCFPVHAGIILRKIDFPFMLVEGVPTQLNRMLSEGVVDVSPSSSIEYAMNPGSYLLLPDLSITSKAKVRSILLESRVPIQELNKRIVALTTASATSIVLLRILLEIRYSAVPVYIRYEQGVENPKDRADAILTIGDLALSKAPDQGYPYRYDLGELWREFTGLPFVFALWQVNSRKPVHKELARLYDILMESRAYGLSHLRELASESADRCGIPEPILLEYWDLFSYGFGDEEQKGLLAYYEYAATLGAIAPVKDLRFWAKS